MEHLNEHTKHFLDWLSLAAVVGTLVTWLPAIAALFSAIWTILRLVEMWTGKTISQLRKEKRK